MSTTLQPQPAATSICISIKPLMIIIPLSLLSLIDPIKEVKSERDSMQSVSSTSSFAVNNVTLTRTGTHSSIGIRTSTLLTSVSKPMPRSVSTGHENSPSPSVITVQFVNNGADSNGSLSDTSSAASNAFHRHQVESEGESIK